MAADKTSVAEQRKPKKTAPRKAARTKLNPVKTAAKPVPKVAPRPDAKATPRPAARLAANPAPAPRSATKVAPEPAKRLTPRPRPGGGAKLRPVKASPQQVKLWNSLKPEQKMALREREAVRLFAQGLERHRAGDLDAAARLYGQALLLDAKLPDVYNNFGVVLHRLGKGEAAVACYRRSLVLKPNNAGAFTNLGNVLRELGRLEVAAASHRRAIVLAPDSADAHYNLGLALRDLGDSDAALEEFATTLKLDPNHADCRWDRALTLLQKGDFAEGFKEYEWRWKLKRAEPRNFKQPLWDGGVLKGKTILIHAEQGFGDMIHFARYIPMVKAKGGNVVVEVAAPLARLFSTVPGVSQVVNQGAQLPTFDVYAPMMSLARIFGTTLETIPTNVPYLKAPEAHAPQLPATMSRARKVGIAWAGRRTHQNDANRSVTFTQFIELLGLPQATFYSLQWGPEAADIANNGCAPFVLNLGTRLGDFATTAGVIEQLDLVISVDTVVAHLAGALGKPVWVLLSMPCDWRWMNGRDDSPWYPTMRLFRQQRPGVWDPVFERARKALHDDILGREPKA
ncbi:MAG: tetratricopeptide repeat protein [Rhodospirillales bacterium]